MTNQEITAAVAAAIEIVNDSYLAERRNMEIMLESVLQVGQNLVVNMSVRAGYESNPQAVMFPLSYVTRQHMLVSQLTF